MITKSILSSGNKIEGELDVEAYNRRILGAHVLFGGGLDYAVDLAPRTPSNVTIRLDLASGQATLWAGRLTGQPHVTATGPVLLPFMRIDGPDLQVARLDVDAAAGNIDVALLNVSGKAQSLSISGSPFTWRFGSPSLTIARLEAGAEQSSERFSFSSATRLALWPSPPPTPALAPPWAIPFFTAPPPRHSRALAN